MSTKRATKRALLTSILAICLCLVMLIGSTFAWFTDTASTGVNQIKSGTLKVDIVDSTGASLTSKENNRKLEFKNKQGSNDILWEPGVTFNTEVFKIKNAGNLALKWKLEINEDSVADARVDTTNTEPLTVSLLDVIKFSIVNATTNEAVSIEDFEDNLSPESLSGEYYLQGKMDTTAGNEYQGLTLNGVGITVYAKQYTEEYDSFNNTYDADAEYGNVDIITITPEDISTTSFSKSNTVYYFDGAFESVRVTSANNVKNVSFIAKEGATFTGDVTIQYHAGNRDEALAASSSLTVKGFKTDGNLTIVSRDKNVVVEGNSAKQIKLQAHDVASNIQIKNNSMNGSEKYGFWLDPFVSGYDLVISGNTFTNISSHAIGIQGDAGTGIENSTAAKSIAVTNNTFTSYGVNNESNRAAFKIWRDTKLAPTENGELTTDANALVAAINAGSNTFGTLGKNCVLADFYGKAVPFTTTNP